LENPTDFPLVRSIFSKLVACTRNYPYTKRWAAYKKSHRTVKHIWFLPTLKANAEKPKELALSHRT